MSRVVIRSWGELKEGETFYFRSPTRTFKYRVGSKNWKTRSIEVELDVPNRKRPVRIVLFNIPFFIKEGSLRRKP